MKKPKMCDNCGERIADVHTEVEDLCGECYWENLCESREFYQCQVLGG